MRILLSIALLYSMFSSCSPISSNYLDTEVKPLLDFIFTDNLVLKYNEPIRFWGWTLPKSQIEVSFDDQLYKARSSASGKWTLDIPKITGSGPFQLEVSTEEGQSVAVKNIVLGEVWLCAGQSNMAWPVFKSQSHESVLENCCADFRYRHIKKSVSTEIRESLDDTNAKAWLVPTVDNCKTFSAVAYHFGEQLKASLDSQHLGIIETTYSDSRIEPWLQNTKGLTNPTAKSYNEPGAIFNAMLEPLADFPISGIVWYQGESNNLNAVDSYNYRTALLKLINEFRNRWGEDLKVVIVQLPNYESMPVDGNQNWAILRESQASVAVQQNVAVVSTIDIGDSKLLHPLDKLSVGKRAAVAAESLLRNTENLSSGPVYNGHRVDGDKVIIEFSHIGDSLNVRASRVLAFNVIDNDGQKHSVIGRVIDNVVEIDLSEISIPVEVQYAWENCPLDLALYNGAGYPASSFRFKLN